MAPYPINPATTLDSPCTATVTCHYNHNDTFAPDAVLLHQHQRCSRRQIRPRSLPRLTKSRDGKSELVDSEPAKKRLRRQEVSSPSHLNECSSLPPSSFIISGDQSLALAAANPNNFVECVKRHQEQPSSCPSPSFNGHLQSPLSGRSHSSKSFNRRDDRHDDFQKRRASENNKANDSWIALESQSVFESPIGLSSLTGKHDSEPLAGSNDSLEQPQCNELPSDPISASTGRSVVSILNIPDVLDLCRIDHGWSPARATVCRQALARASSFDVDDPVLGERSLGDRRMQLDDFIKIMQIGQGAYGDVWLAQDIRRKKLVALKKLKLNEEREGFPKNAIREISLLRYLRHPNIVGFYGMVYSRPRLDSLKPIFSITSSLSAVSRACYGFGISAARQKLKEKDEIFLPITNQNGHHDFDGAVFPIERHRLNGSQQPLTRPLLQTVPCKSSVWMVFEYLPFDLNGIIEQLRDQDKQVGDQIKIDVKFF